MEPTIARPKPYLVTLRAGRSYFWCRCGLSKKQPFCDGSHVGTSFEPLKYTAQTDGEEVLFCGCKYTRTAPFCDGAHTNLPGGSPLDDPNSPTNVAVPLVPPSPADPRTMLDGGCYVFSPSRAELLTAGSLRYCEAISGKLGAQYQTTLYVQAMEGTSPVMRLPNLEVIIFVSSGAGAIVISGRRFEIAGSDGVYVRAGEAFQFVNAASAPIEAFITACPAGPVEWLDEMPQNFDAAYPTRIVSVDPNQRTAMGSRYFQCLVDKSIGSNVITQFIGHIPQSKAAPHRHLYEESIIVLSGEGCMWTESGKASVRAGDVIFLPRKQEHSLESLNSEGLDVVGVICPGDNPSINY
jgi:mannose-6-phosphate isomerase-like protein (cupin superfamily)/CDGSH-type Zn-finger protein